MGNRQSHTVEEGRPEADDSEEQRVSHREGSPSNAQDGGNEEANNNEGEEVSVEDIPEEYKEEDDPSENAITRAIRGEDSPIIATAKDHFSLLVPTSRVRYRDGSSGARVLQAENSQVVLEDSYDPKTGKSDVSIRRVVDTTQGVWFLRAIYTLITVFFTGFFFIMCLQILLFLMFDLALEAGATTNQRADWGVAIGLILSLVIFVYGLASALVIAGAFVIDTWRGHQLMSNFVLRQLSPVAVEWTFFSFFLAVPILVMSICLFVRTPKWWEITLLCWFSCVFIFYLLFVANVVLYEFQVCWTVNRSFYKDDKFGFFQTIVASVLMRERTNYCSNRAVKYLSSGSISNLEYTDKELEDNAIAGTKIDRVSVFAKCKKWNWLSTNGGIGFFETLEEERRMYSIDDVRDVRPYLTKTSWSLEKIFCRPRNSRFVVILFGPGAVTREQAESSLACSFLGCTLIILVIVSAFVYLDLNAIFVAIAAVLAVLVAAPSMLKSLKLYSLMKRIGKGAREKRSREFKDRLGSQVNLRVSMVSQSEAVYLVSQKYRVVQPTNLFCWIMFTVEVGLFFVWPTITLFLAENPALGGLFVGIGIVSFFRHYVSASLVLEETGSLDLFDCATDEEKWAKQSRLGEIIGNITQSRSRLAWMLVLAVFGLGFLGLAVSASGTSDPATATGPANFIFLPEFEYLTPDSTIQYPSCNMSSFLDGGPLNAMRDFSFLSSLAYAQSGVLQEKLDQWFGNGTAVDQVDLVERWNHGSNSPASFKMITFPDDGNFTYVAVRGTSNSWDLFTDAQLWSAAGLLQILRFVIPVGQSFTSVFQYLIYLVTRLQSVHLREVSYYRDVSSFVQFTKMNIPDLYAGVALTGHSLGGGVSMISGAQTSTPAVSVSGPNAVLSGRSFDPPVDTNQLNTWTFNIIPDRDIIPMFDDRAQNFQQISCTTAPADYPGCHTSTRTLCELLYTCGTGPRPAICECVTRYNYPKPVPRPGANRTFEEACGL